MSQNITDFLIHSKKPTRLKFKKFLFSFIDSTSNQIIATCIVDSGYDINDFDENITEGLCSVFPNVNVSASIDSGDFYKYFNEHETHQEIPSKVVDFYYGDGETLDNHNFQFQVVMFNEGVEEFKKEKERYKSEAISKNNLFLEYLISKYNVSKSEINFLINNYFVENNIMPLTKEKISSIESKISNYVDVKNS